MRLIVVVSFFILSSFGSSLYCQNLIEVKQFRGHDENGASYTIKVDIYDNGSSILWHRIIYRADKYLRRPSDSIGYYGGWIKGDNIYYTGNCSRPPVMVKDCPQNTANDEACKCYLEYDNKSGKWWYSTKMGDNSIRRVELTLQEDEKK